MRRCARRFVRGLWPWRPLARGSATPTPDAAIRLRGAVDLDQHGATVRRAQEIDHASGSDPEEVADDFRQSDLALARHFDGHVGLLPFLLSLCSISAEIAVPDSPAMLICTASLAPIDFARYTRARRRPA